MNARKLLKISLLTLPVSVAVFLIFNVLMRFVMGGVATTRGFPVPYYRDVWNTPGIDFNQPAIAVLDVLVVYLLVTFVVYNLIGSEEVGRGSAQ